MVSDPAARPRLARFGVFQLDLRAGELRKRGSRIRLQQQPFRVLEILLERAGEVVSRDELRQRLWPSDTWVDFDHGLNKAVNKLRETLGDSAESPRFIETLPKRGYRFLAPVEYVADTAQPTVESVASPVAAAPSASPPRIETIESPGRAPIRVRTRVWLALTAVAIVTTAGALLWNALRPRSAGADRLMLAVLPFANLEGDPGQDYFCDGMTDEMILQLGRLNADRLGVIARTSSMHYKGSNKRVDEIATELGVQYVLEGSVRRRGRSVRITARLVRKDDQTPLWSESYERDIAQVVDIQSEVARRIADSLALELRVASDTDAVVAKTDAAAYDAYLLGRYHWNRRTPPDLVRAVESLKQAIALDPNYVPAHAALADALNVLPWYGLQRPRDVYPQSKEIARRALALDPSSAGAHTALAYAHHYYDWDWPQAQEEYGRALALNPNYAQAHQWFAAHLAETARTDDALAEMERARRLDPRSLIINAAIGWINYLGRRYDRAESQLRATLQQAPDFVPARLWLGQTLEASGRAAEAIEHYLHVRGVAGSAPTGLGELARGYAAAGRAADARRLLDELLATAATRYVEADLIARVYEALGERDRAVEWLERGFEERAAKLVLIGVDPQFDRLREDSRFHAMLDRLKLSPKGSQR